MGDIFENYENAEIEFAVGNYENAIHCYNQYLDDISVFEYFSQGLLSDLRDENENWSMKLKAKAWFGKGKCFHALGKYRDAALSLQRIPDNFQIGDHFLGLEGFYSRMLELGNIASNEERHTDAMLFYHAANSLDGYDEKHAKLGYIISQFKKENRNQSWLSEKLRCLPIPHHLLNAKKFHFLKIGKQKVLSGQYEKGISDLIISCTILTSQGEMVPSECIQIKKELGKAYVGAGKTKDALETFDECEKLMKGFYLNLWKSQKCEGWQEIVKNPDRAEKRFKLASVIFSKRLKNEKSIRADAVKHHLHLINKLFDIEDKDDYLMECIDVIFEYCQANSFCEKDLAAALKLCGNKFLKKKNIPNAKKVYKRALDVSPKNCDLHRDLLSNYSHVLEVSGDPSTAVFYAKKCVETYPAWPKGYLRLGKAYHIEKNYKLAHKAYCNCFDRARVEEKSEVVSHIFINMAAAEKDKINLTQPKDITTQHINKCISSILKSTDPALDAINIIFTSPILSPGIIAGAIPLAAIIKHGTTADAVTKMIERGAPLTAEDGSETSLDAALSLPQSQKASEIVHVLIKREIDVSKYIPRIQNEPYVHTLVRLCLRIDRLDILKSINTDLDLSVTDNSGNNILHLLAKSPAPIPAKKCLELFVKTRNINPKDQNKELKKPLQLVKSRTDGRWAILNDYEKRFQNTTQNTKKKKKKKRKRNNGNRSLEETCSVVVADEQVVEDEGSVLQEECPTLDNSRDAEKVASNDQVVSTYAQTRLNIKKYIEEFVPVKLEDIIASREEDVQTVEDSATTSRSSQNNGEIPAPVEKAPPDDKIPFHDDDDDDDDDDGNQIDGYNDTEFEELDEFEGLTWDVQCTSEFLKKLKDKKLAYKFKRKILDMIRLLATGDWRRKLAINLNVPGIRLYKARITKAARMIWEEAIAFSERRTHSEAVNADTQGVVYCDVIRLWDFTFDHDEVDEMIGRIKQSHVRGQSCAIRKELKTIKNARSSDRMRCPRVYIAMSNAGKESRGALTPSKSNETCDELFSPSASPNEREYHILKFYTMTTAMAKSVLCVNSQTYDFPFEVSELELYIIRLQPKPDASVLLLGRSGTGKTTCCLYRLWSRFKSYWEQAVTAGPCIPSIKWLLQRAERKGNQGSFDQESNTGSTESNSDIRYEGGNAFNRNAGDKEKAENKVMACGCKGSHCLCALAIARANFVIDGEVEQDGTQQTYQDTSSDEKVPENSIEDDDQECENEESQYRHLRQLFITKNKVLCHEVKKNFKDLCTGLPVARDHVAFTSDDAIVDFNDVNDMSYPLFLGSRDLLMTLDASLPGRSFFARDSSGKLISPIAGWGKKESHLSFLPVLDFDQDSDDEEDDDDDQKEADDDVDDDVDDRIIKISKTTSSVKREVTYAFFVTQVWPTIEKKFKSGYHPSLVWTEFCSFIKGTVEALIERTGCMSKESYKSIGRKKAPNFSGDRTVIYNMYKLYQKICLQKNLFDELDVLYNVYNRLNSNPYQPWLFDQIYVDETQDFTEAELFTLVRCCQNPNQLFFTGDTAQSIMRGVTFRFSDLRSLFFNAQKALNTKKSIINVPNEVHQLTYNYRSHKGILKLASSIVDLMAHFFPESFDKLQSDVGLFDGPKPVILEISDFSDLAIMLRGARRKTSPIEFGAHQVVLVSSEQSKESLPEELGCALVLTIYEAKGLEFDDVLLYNFFKDSQAKKEWRVVSQYVETEEFSIRLKRQVSESNDFGLASKGEDELSFESRPLDFDYNKHKILNSELKQLYTALTRARVNVWIYDEDTLNRAPMFDYFKRSGLVKIMKMEQVESERLVEHGSFAEKSTEADWEAQGHFFYKKELWSVAVKCFHKANNTVMVSRCEAYIQAMKAYKMGIEWRETRSGTQKNVKTEFLKATELFLMNGMGDEATTCLQNAKEWMLLGDLSLKIQKRREAGKFYAKAEDDVGALKASECFKTIGDYRSAVDILYKHQLFRECIESLKEYNDKVQDGSRYLKPPRSTMSTEKVVKDAADICYQRKDQVAMKKMLKELPFEQQIAYLGPKRGCEDLKLEIFVDNGRAQDAAKIYFDKQKYLKAAECSKKDSFKAMCYLEFARNAWMQYTDEMPESEVANAVSYLQKCIAVLPNSDSNRANASFLLWTITKDCLHLREATKCYEEARNSFGWLLCMSVTLNTAELENISTRDLFSCLSKCYLQIISILSKRTPDVVRKLQEFFGIEKTISADSTKFNLNKQKFSFSLRALKSEEISLRKIRGAFDINEGQGNALLVISLLPAIEAIYSKLNGIYQEMLKTTKFCDLFLHGLPHRDCTDRHEFPNGRNSPERLNAHFAVIQLQGATRKLVEVIKTDPVLENEISRYKALGDGYYKEVMMRKCDELYADLVRCARYLNEDNFPGMQLVKSIPGDMNYVKEQIVWFSRACWEIEKKNYNNVNLFLKALHMANYAGDSYMVFEIRSLRDQISSVLPKEGEIKTKLFSFNERERKIESFYTLFLESKECLHDTGTLSDSLHYLLRRALAMPVTGGKTVPLLAMPNVLALLEFSVTLCLMSLSRTANPSGGDVRKPKYHKIHIPAFYSEGVLFRSGIYEYSQKPEYSAWDTITWLTYTSGTKQIRSLIQVILDWLLMKKYKAQDLFQEAFSPKGVESGDSERFLILLLVILANFNLISEVESYYKGIIQQLHDFAPSYPMSATRVYKALKKACLIRQPLDALNLLSKLLKDGGNGLIKRNWKQMLSYVHQYYLEPEETRSPEKAGNPSQERSAAARKASSGEVPPRFLKKSYREVLRKNADHSSKRNAGSEGTSDSKGSDEKIVTFGSTASKNSLLDKVDGPDNASEGRPSVERFLSSGDDESQDEDAARQRRDEERKKNEEIKKQRRQLSANKIKLWWKIIFQSKRKTSTFQMDDESLVAAHVSKYALDLRCVPCGQTYLTKEELANHFLNDTGHGNMITEYDQFKAYEKIVQFWQKRAEKLLDTDLQEGIVSDKDMGEPVYHVLSQIAIALNFIVRARKWVDLENLKGLVEELQRACCKVEEEIALQGDQDDIEDDFQVVTYKKKGKQTKKKQKQKGNKGR